MADFIIALVLVVIIGAAARYMIKAKKRGVKCIGCSVDGGCLHQSNQTSAACGCGCDNGTNACSCHADTK